jgi:hypothetical protein
MAARYFSWLLLDEGANKDLQTVLKEQFQGLFGKSNLTRRPKASLRMRQRSDRTMFVDEEDQFINIVKSGLLPGGRRGVRAFSTAPLDELKSLHGVWLRTSRMNAFEISADAVEDPERQSDPYYRRFLTIRELTGTTSHLPGREPVGGPGGPIAGGREGAAIQVTRGTGFTPDLYFDPVRLEMSDKSLNFLFEMFGAEQGWGEQLNGFVLPPVFQEAPYDTDEDLEEARNEGTADYLSPGYRRLRRSLRLAMGFRGDRDLPSAIALGRILDDPLFRDVARDGGTLRIAFKNAAPTHWRAQFCTSGGVARYRATVFCDPTVLRVQGWPRDRVVRIGEALLADLRLLATYSDPPILSEQKADWSLGPSGRFLPGAASSTGSYALFASIQSRFEDQDEKALFQELVLAPSKHPGEEFPSHAFAEHRVRRFLFRCPWTPLPDFPGPSVGAPGWTDRRHAEDSATRQRGVLFDADHCQGNPRHARPREWTRAWLDCLRTLALDACQPDAEIRMRCYEDLKAFAESRGSDLKCRLDTRSRDPLILHSYRASAVDILELRLLAPLGVTLRADSTVRLDTEAGYMDKEFVLG